MKRVICSYFLGALFLRLPVTTCQLSSELSGGLPWLGLLSWLLSFSGLPGRLPWLELPLFELLFWLPCFEWSCSDLPGAVSSCADPEGLQPANFVSAGQFTSGSSGRHSLFNVNAVQETDLLIRSISGCSRPGLTAFTPVFGGTRCAIWIVLGGPTLIEPLRSA